MRCTAPPSDAFGKIYNAVGLGGRTDGSVSAAYAKRAIRGLDLVGPLTLRPTDHRHTKAKGVMF